MEIDGKISASGDGSVSSGKRKKENESSDAATEEKMLRVLLGSSSKWRKKVVGQSIPDTRLFRLLDRTISPDIDEKAIRNPIPHKLVSFILHLLLLLLIVDDDFFDTNVRCS